MRIRGEYPCFNREIGMKAGFGKHFSTRFQISWFDIDEIAISERLTDTPSDALII